MMRLGRTAVKTTEVDEPDLKARIGEVLSRWPVAGLAVGVVRHGSLALAALRPLAVPTSPTIAPPPSPFSPV